MTCRADNILGQDILDKDMPSWNGDSYCIPRPIFFDGGGTMREENGIVLFDLGPVLSG